MQYTVTIAWFSDAISCKPPFHQAVLELLVGTGNCSQMSHCISALCPWQEGIRIRIQGLSAILKSQTTCWHFPIQPQIFFLSSHAAVLWSSCQSEQSHCTAMKASDQRHDGTATQIDRVMREHWAVKEMIGQAQSVCQVVWGESQRDSMLATDGKIADTWHVEI